MRSLFWDHFEQFSSYRLMIDQLFQILELNYQKETYYKNAGIGRPQVSTPS